VKRRALALGFDVCGVARAEPIEEGPLRTWIERGWHAGLTYMEQRLEERLDPGRLVPGARSVIVLGASCGASCGAGAGAGAGEGAGEGAGAGALRVARYARGRDYHNVLLRPARKLAAWLRREGAAVYAAVDTGAVAERAFGMRAGLGWIGKSGMLISPEWGTWLLLGALVTDLVLEPDAPALDACGACTACLHACPTQAIGGDRLVDSRRCIAFHTIEHRGPIPEEVARGLGDRIFGCDACQEVCPPNLTARPGRHPAFAPRPGQSAISLGELLALGDEEAEQRFRGTPLARAGREGLLRTARAIAATPTLAPAPTPTPTPPPAAPTATPFGT
jgi:epoxyqueuosine reductase